MTGRVAHNRAARAVFIDRDGTILKDLGYLHSPDEAHLLPGVGRALARLRKAGWKLIMVSNQSGIERGFYTHPQVRAVNRAMQAMLGKFGARLDAIYYCPHHPCQKCACRKPGTRMVDRAAKKFRLDLKKCFIIGDQPADSAMARAAGCKAVFIFTGPGPDAWRRFQARRAGADFAARSMKEAVNWIMRRTK